MANTELHPLVPEDWQPDFMTDMHKVAGDIANGRLYPGYPPLFERLYIPESNIQYTPDGRPILPFNPYAPFTLHDHSGHSDISKARPDTAFHDLGQSLSSEEGARFRWPEDGGLDNRNFPLHPFWKEMVTDERIGGIVSPGYYWEPGPNPTADLAALAFKATSSGVCLHALTIVRRDTGQGALPGGHYDRGEFGFDTALRETREETGVDLSHLTPEHIWEGPVADPRLTLHAGPRTSLALVDVKELPTTQQKGGDDAEHAQWRVMDKEWIDNAFGSHGTLGMLAVRRWQERNALVVLENGLVVANG